MKTTTALINEMYEEENIQDLLFLQQAEYDEERELLNIYSPHIKKKRLFSNKIRFKNRRNTYRFAKTYYPHQILPF